MKIFSTPILALAVLAGFVAFIWSTRISCDDYPTEFEEPLLPQTFGEALDLASFPVTPSTPVGLRNWSFSVGSYSFGLVDCATQFRGNQPTSRITLVQFGTWGEFCNFHAEDLVLGVAMAIGVLAATGCIRHIYNRHDARPCHTP